MQAMDLIFRRPFVASFCMYTYRKCIPYYYCLKEEKILSITWYKVLKWTVKPKSPWGGLSRKSEPHVAEPSTGPIPIKPKSAIKGFTLLKNHCSSLYFNSSDSQQVHSRYHGKKQQQAQILHFLKCSLVYNTL